MLKALWRAIDNDEGVASSEKKNEFKTSAKKHALFETKMTKYQHPSLTKTAEKTHTLWGCTYLYSSYKGVAPEIFP